jgi:DNA-binding MarR family transcriptional regulator
MEYANILIRIRQIVRAVNVESKRLEKEYGISIPQLLALNYLRKQDYFRASHKELKDFLQLNASTVTGIISRLETKGLIARLPRHEDRRVAYVTITAKGSELLEAMPEPMHERISQKLKGLSAGELVELERAFDTISHILDIDTGDSAPIVSAEINAN